MSFERKSEFDSVQSGFNGETESAWKDLSLQPKQADGPNRRGEQTEVEKANKLATRTKWSLTLTKSLEKSRNRHKLPDASRVLWLLK